MPVASRAARLTLAVCAAMSLVPIAGCESKTPAGPPVARPSPVTAWLTTADRQHLLAPGGVLPPSPSPSPSTVVLEVRPQERFQSMVGFGGAITDASAWLIRHGLDDARRDALMNELFGRGPGGVGFEFTRLTIGASDFSRTHYSLDDMPPGASDPELRHFSIDPEREDVIPVVRQALAIAPQLKVMASPWSAPGWMKTNDRLVGGRLRPDRHDDFSRYLVRYVEEMGRAGVPLYALSAQNEPHNETKDYPGMLIETADRAALIGRHLGPLMKARTPGVKLLEWDHNWDVPESPLGVLADPAARAYVSGVAWHCYDGDPSAQSKVQAAYPGIDVWFSECSGGDWKPDWAETLPWMMRNLVIGSTRNGARGVLMWNLALDPAHGPHLGGCNDCRGMVTIDPRTGEVTRNMEYYAFAHASRFTRQGAVRIGSTSGVERLDSVAFRNPDGSTVLVVCNSASRTRRFAVRGAGADFAYDLPASGVVTFVW